MLIRCRAVLMWVLLIALPFQGYAAATMLGCGPDHHRTSLPTHVHDEVVSAAAVGVHQHAASDDHHHPDQASKCSVCAACCVSAALPAKALVFSAAEPVGAPTRLLAMGPVGFLTDGPDRPPRISLV